MKCRSDIRSVSRITSPLCAFVDAWRRRPAIREIALQRFGHATFRDSLEIGLEALDPERQILRRFCGVARLKLRLFDRTHECVAVRYFQKTRRGAIAARHSARTTRVRLRFHVRKIVQPARAPRQSPYGLSIRSTVGTGHRKRAPKRRASRTLCSGLSRNGEAVVLALRRDEYEIRVAAVDRRRQRIERHVRRPLPSERREPANDRSRSASNET